MEKTPYTIIVREGAYSNVTWRQYGIVTDMRVAWVEMTQAMFGWNIGKVDIQDAEHWPNMTEARIVAWMLRNNDGRSRVVSDSEFAPEFLAKLLTAVGVR